MSGRRYAVTRRGFRRDRLNEETGQGLVEYSLILLLVAIALAGALGILATDIGNSILDSAAALGA